MITLTESKCKDLIKGIVRDPKLWKLTYGQALSEVDSFELEEDYIYLIIRKDDLLIGCYTYRPFTKNVAEVHAFILSEFWGSGISKEVASSAYEYFINKGFIKLFTTVPDICIHVLKHLSYLGFTACGSIKDGIVFNHRLCTLFLFEKDLRNIK